MLDEVLRGVHVFFGVIWVGVYFSMFLIVWPGINKLGNGMQGRFFQAISPALTPIMGGSGLITLVSGIWWMLRLRSGNLGTLFASGWGWAMIIGLVLTLGVMIIAIIMLDPLQRKAEKVGHAAAGHAPNQEEARELDALSHKWKMAFNVNLVFMFIIFVDMIITRYL